MVELPSNYNGKELKIKFNVQQSDATSIIKNIAIMSENDYFNYQIRSNKVVFYPVSKYRL